MKEIRADMAIILAHMPTPSHREWVRQVFAWCENEITNGGPSEAVFLAAGRHMAGDVSWPEFVAAYDALMMTKEGARPTLLGVMH